jgi:hypothetical protein
MNHKEAYKAPFKLDDFDEETVWTVDNDMAFQFIEDVLSLTIKLAIVSYLNEDYTDKSLFANYKLSYDNNAQHIIATSLDNTSEKTIINIRGWGNLIGIGGLNLHPSKAAKIQDDFANWIIERLS